MIQELINTLERIEKDAQEGLDRIKSGDAPKGSTALTKIRGEAYGARFWAEAKLLERSGQPGPERSTKRAAA